jgi:hypothetical protein
MKYRILDLSALDKKSKQDFNDRIDISEHKIKGDIEDIDKNG